MTPGERKLLVDLERGPMRTTNGRPFARLFEAGFIARVVANIYRINHAGKAALDCGRLHPTDLVPVELVVRDPRTCTRCSSTFFPYRDWQRYCGRKCRRAARYLRGLQVTLPGVRL